MVNKKKVISKNEKLVLEKHLFYVTVTAVISVIAILLVILIMSKYSATTIVDEQGNLVGQAKAFRTVQPMQTTTSSTKSTTLVKRSQTYILSQGQSCVSLAAQVADINSRLLQPKLQQLSQAYDQIGNIKSSSAYLDLVSSKATLNGEIEALNDLRNDIFILCQQMGILQGGSTQTTAQDACWNAHQEEYSQLSSEIADKKIEVANIEREMEALLDNAYQLLNNIQIEVNQYAGNINDLNLQREELGCDLARG